MGKTVIFGGTFNPIHSAHVEMIGYICSLPEVESLLLIPTAVPPHKITDLAPDEHRLAMCKRAVMGLDKVQVLDIETKAGGKSYTLNTLERLKEQYPLTEFVLLIGGDMLATFHEWKRYDEILKQTELWALVRKGYQLEQFEASANRLRSEGGIVKILPYLPREISSTLIRKTIKEHGKIDTLVPDSVAEYIEKNNLYCE